MNIDPGDRPLFATSAGMQPGHDWGKTLPSAVPGSKPSACSWRPPFLTSIQISWNGRMPGNGPILMSHHHDVILIADDNDDHVALLLRAFRKGPVLNPIIVVRDGDEAIKYLRGVDRFQNRDEYPLPSLLLLDLRMPNVDGFEVLEWIRHHPFFKALRVVVLTTSEDMHDITRAYQLGANSFLVKPTDLSGFTTIADVLQGHWLWMSKAPEVTRPAKQAEVET